MSDDWQGVVQSGACLEKKVEHLKKMRMFSGMPDSSVLALMQIQDLTLLADDPEWESKKCVRTVIFKVVLPYFHRLAKNVAGIIRSSHLLHQTLKRDKKI